MTDSQSVVSEVVDNDNETTAPRCPGHLLTEAREAKGLTVRGVATELRLHGSLIEALEEGDLEQLPPMTFVNGYLRSYAKLLGLDADPLVEQYGLCASDGPQLVSTDKTSTEVKSSDLSMRLVTYVVVIGLLVLVVMWWSANRETMPVEPLVEAPVAATAEPAVMPAEVDSAESPATPPVEETGTTEPPQEAVSADKMAVEAEPMLVQESEEAVAADTRQQEVAEQVVLVDPLTDATPQSKLQLELTEDSWVEVKDAAGRRLAYGLAEAGESRELRGEAPFSVFLGYAPGVAIRYNDKAFDHTPFQRRELARFRVGRDSDNRPREQ